MSKNFKNPDMIRVVRLVRGYLCRSCGVCTPGLASLIARPWPLFLAVLQCLLDALENLDGTSGE